MSIAIAIEPRRGSNLGNANATINPGTDHCSDYQLPPATLTLDRNLTLGVVGLTPGQNFIVRIARFDLTGNQLAVIDGATAQSVFAFGASPSAALGASFYFNGTSWVFLSSYNIDATNDLSSTTVGQGAALVGLSTIAGMVSTNVQAGIAELYNNPVFGSDTSIQQANASSILKTTLRTINAYTSNVNGAEVSNWVVQCLLAGATTTALDIRGDSTIFPAGAAAPSVKFATGVGFGYDSGQPALCLFINGRKHLLYANALLMDPGASSIGGLFLDQGQNGGVPFSGGGTSVTLRAVGVDGIEVTAAGGRVWGRATAGATITAGRAVTFNSSGNIIHGDATTPTTCIGISVAGAANAAPCNYLQLGIAAGVLSGATPGTRYYLGTTGVLTTTRNTTSGQSQIQIGVAASATDLLVQLHDRGINP